MQSFQVVDKLSAILWRIEKARRMSNDLSNEIFDKLEPKTIEDVKMRSYNVEQRKPTMEILEEQLFLVTAEVEALRAKFDSNMTIDSIA